MNNLSKLMSPKSIAVIGGGEWSRSVIQQCRKFGFRGMIWSVHPEKKPIGADETFAAIENLPHPPDAAFVAVNRETTISVIQSLSLIGAKGAVCFASGFLESDAETGNGSKLQKALIEAAGDMPILGPNCYGFINSLDRTVIWPDQHGAQSCDRGVAIITQSSNIAINITMQKRGLPIGMVVTAGNQAQLSISDIGKHVLSDPRITALGLHIEGVTNPQDFYDLAKFAHKMNKGVVVLKVGKSAQAQHATISHTASLAGSAQTAMAFFDRLGFGQVDDLETFVETLKILHTLGPLPGNRIASMSCSGGEASLVADLALGHMVTLPPLSHHQKTQLRHALGSKVALANPLDYHTYIWGDTVSMGSCFAAMLDPKTIDIALVIVDFPRSDTCDPSGWDCVIDAVKLAQKHAQVPLALVSSFAEGIDEALQIKLRNAGILCLNGLHASLGAIAASTKKQPPDIAPFAPIRTKNSEIHFEADTKKGLAHFEIPTPQTRIVFNLKDLKSYFYDHSGPFVLKTTHSAHKSETDGVTLNLKTWNDVKLAAIHYDRWPLVVEQMVENVIAELLIGIVNDGVHGVLLTLGSGGIYTEILNDTTHVILPATRDEIAAALSKLKIYPVLKGYRGKAGTNIDMLVDTILKIQSFVENNKDNLLELEINPLLIRKNDAIAADALMRKELK